MKLSTWARKRGVSYKTAWRWWKAGTLSARVEQMPSGTLIVHEDEPASPVAALYARVSGSGQRADLERQQERLRAAALERGLEVVHEVAEVGSGLNGERAGLLRLLRDQRVGIILVEHRDRIARFGFEYLEASLHAQGRRIVVLETAEVEDDLVRDMVEVLTSFCARLYGRRSARRRALAAVKAAEEESPA